MRVVSGCFVAFVISGCRGGQESSGEVTSSPVPVTNVNKTAPNAPGHEIATHQSNQELSVELLEKSAPAKTDEPKSEEKLFEPPAGWELLKPYYEAVNDCEDQYLRNPLEPVSCAFDDSITVEGFGNLKIGEKRTNKHGEYVFPLENSALILKVLPDDKHWTVCRERVALSMLNGLEGFVPRVYNITSGVKPECLIRTIVIDQLGDDNWRIMRRAVESKYDSDFYHRAARLVKAVRALHEKGFNSGGLGETNVRIKRHHPWFVGLGDLTGVYPLFSVRTGGYELGDQSRRGDMRAVSWMMELGTYADPQWVNQFQNEMDSLAGDARPNYEKWISFFEQKM